MAKVVVLGSSGYDLTVRLARLPRPGETLLGGVLHTGPGGKGANQAIAAKRAGAEVRFLSAFGDDAFGKLALENVHREGLDLRFVKIANEVSNQVALIFVGENGENAIGVAPGASLTLSNQDIDVLPDAVFDPGGIFLASLEIPLLTVLRGMERAKRAGMRTILNPAPMSDALRETEVLKLVEVLTPNEDEAFGLAGLVPSETNEGIAACARMLHSLGPRHVLITLGERGCVLESGEGPTWIPAAQVEAIDTVGAGDAFNGALAAALSEGMTLIEAAHWATCAGAIAVTKPGAQGALPSREEIAALAKHIQARVEI